MTVWIIEPRDPLIVRDGKPFGPTPGARSTSLAFPFPSTTTGGVRTRVGINAQGVFTLSKEEAEKLKNIKVRGPLLVQLAENGDSTDIVQWFAPAPADALLIDDEQQTGNGFIRSLVPVQPFSGAQTDFSSVTSDENNYKKLHLVGLSVIDNDSKHKPAKEPPRYWNWNTFQEWLFDPQSFEKETRQFSQLGHSGPQRDQRLHVSIDPSTGAALDGALFATSGLEFTLAEKRQLKAAQRLALAVSTEEAISDMKEGLASFGGERRIVSWRKSSSNFPFSPKEEEIEKKKIEKIEDKIVHDRHCRLILLTPACFDGGYFPHWLTQPRAGVTSQVQAIAIQRPQVVSGWDLIIGKPKPTRRLAPAGSVFFLSLQGNADNIRKWIGDTWMHSTSDQEPDRTDSFGLAVLGTWSGEPETMRMEQQS